MRRQLRARFVWYLLHFNWRHLLAGNIYNLEIYFSLSVSGRCLPGLAGGGCSAQHSTELPTFYFFLRGDKHGAAIKVVFISHFELHFISMLVQLIRKIFQNFLWKSFWRPFPSAPLLELLSNFPILHFLVCAEARQASYSRESSRSRDKEISNSDQD